MKNQKRNQESARGKVELQNQITRPSVPMIESDTKLLHDPMALDWILKALKTH